MVGVNRLARHILAGYFPAFTVANDIGALAVPDFDVDQLGYSYFANTEAPTQMGEPSKDRLRLAEATHRG
jgi:hypothetical protein